MSTITTYPTFTVDEDIKLVELVKKQPYLYDKRPHLPRDLTIRNNLWHDISQQMNKDDEECKKRWSNIYAYYKRVTSKSIILGKPTQWSLAKYLTFLDNYLNNQNDQPLVPRPLTLATEENASSSSSHGDEDDCLIVTKDQCQQLTNNTPAPSTFINSIREFNHNGHMFPKKAKQNDDSFQSLDSGGHKPVINVVPDHEDPLVAFFKYMTLTVQTFPLHLRLKAKDEVFKIISRLEQENNKTA